MWPSVCVSTQIQLFDENDIKVVAKPLLKNYLEKNKIIITDKKSTRWYGQKVFKILKM